MATGFYRNVHKHTYTYIHTHTCARANIHILAHLKGVKIKRMGRQLSVSVLCLACGRFQVQPKALRKKTHSLSFKLARHRALVK